MGTLGGVPTGVGGVWKGAHAPGEVGEGALAREWRGMWQWGRGVKEAFAGSSAFHGVMGAGAWRRGMLGGGGASWV